VNLLLSHDGSPFLFPSFPKSWGGNLMAAAPS
jgi:hypothetical protein